MAIDFPASPTVGQLYTYAGKTWKWNGKGWELVAGVGPTGATGAGSPGATGPTGSAGGGVVQSGGKVLIQAQTVASTVATVDFTSGIDATYDEYELHYYNVVLSDTSGNTLFCIRISQDAGTTWKSGASDYQWTAAYMGDGGNVSAIGSLTAAYIQLSYYNTPANAVPIVGVTRFWTPANTTLKKVFMTDINGQGISGTDLYRGVATGFYYTNNNAINGVRLFPNLGNITSGVFKLYGIKN